MIYFITDRRPGEPDILPSLVHQPLRITSLDGAPIRTIQPPTDGWTHDRLEREARNLAEITKNGADAWLGTTWVGSTEV